MGQELLGRRVKQGAPRPFAPSRRADPAGIHQHIERAFRDLDPADRLDLCAADGLMISDDRQRLGRRARQAARLFARAAKQVGEVRRGLEMPAAAALDQLDPAALVTGGKLAERDLDRPLPDMLCDLFDAQRLGRGKEGCFDRAHQLVHQAALSLIGANGSSCAMSRRPRRASSSAATKLEASAERRNCGSWLGGRKLSRKVQSSAMPIIFETRSIASSRVMTARAWTTCIAGWVRARTAP